MLRLSRQCQSHEIMSIWVEAWQNFKQNKQKQTQTFHFHGKSLIHFNPVYIIAMWSEFIWKWFFGICFIFCRFVPGIAERKLCKFPGRKEETRTEQIILKNVRIFRRWWFASAVAAICHCDRRMIPTTVIICYEGMRSKMKGNTYEGRSSALGSTQI